MSLVLSLKQLDHFVIPIRGCLIAKGFHYLHFSLDESYVHVCLFTHTCIYVYESGIPKKKCFLLAIIEDERIYFARFFPSITR